MVIIGGRTENEMLGIRGGSLYSRVLPLGAFHLLPGNGGGTSSEVGHTRDDGNGTDERFLLNGNIVQIDISVASSIAGGSLEDDDYLLSGVGAKVDRSVLGP